jgi:hypothetical protein
MGKKPCWWRATITTSPHMSQHMHAAAGVGPGILTVEPVVTLEDRLDQILLKEQDRLKMKAGSFEFKMM